MRKILPFVGAALAIFWLVGRAPARAQEPFKDVPTSHWAYAAVTDLQVKGILLGYPDGYFRGKRTLTRYEFAVALERMLTKVLNVASLPAPQGPQGPPGARGPQGPPGPQGPAGDDGLTQDQLDNLQRLLDEFQKELQSLGNDVNAARKQLDALAQKVAAVEKRLDRMIQFNGDLFVGFRSDLSRNAFIDYSGVARAANHSQFSNVSSPSDFHLEARAGLPGGILFNGDLVSSNYLSYRGAAGVYLGGPSAAAPNAGLGQITSLYEANLLFPISGFGRNTSLTLGRFRNQITPLTYYRPDTDPYFDLPWYDDGNFVQDGFKLQTRLGSVGANLFGGSYSSLVGSTAGMVFNKPLIGATNGPRFLSPLAPVDYSVPFTQGAIFANQSVGGHLSLPLFRYGELGLTLIDFSVSGGPAAALPPPDGGMPVNNVLVYGANVRLHPIGRWMINGEFAKSVTLLNRDTSDGRGNDENNGYILNIGYNTGPVSAQVGYQYFDPRFAAPGFWNKLGSWYNPTNVRGPFVRLGYRIAPNLQGFLGGDFLEGARNRPGSVPGSGLGIGDDIVRGTAGIRWNFTPRFSLSADYEGLVYDLSASSSYSGMPAKPVEQYITLGAGYNLSSSMVFKLGYQLINTRDNGFGFLNSTPTGVTNASVFTGQLAVHF